MASIESTARLTEGDYFKAFLAYFASALVAGFAGGSAVATILLMMWGASGLSRDNAALDAIVVVLSLSLALWLNYIAFRLCVRRFIVRKALPDFSWDSDGQLR